MTYESVNGWINTRIKSSYKKEDVELLLKDITGFLDPLPAAEREKLIQGGVHYSEMLPLEYRPSKRYLEAYQSSLKYDAQKTARAVCVLAERLIKEKGKAIVLVSLARAGIPAGILLKHYIEKKWYIKIPHYGISIIRGKGIDHNALKYILSLHTAESIQFVDGWIGKGAISKELKSELVSYPGLSNELAVLADPAYITRLCGTNEDILIPSSCLNSTVSGLISRTVLRSDLIKNGDFHGAVYYEELEKEDRSYEFIDAIEAHFNFNTVIHEIVMGRNGLEEVTEIAEKFGITNVNLIKPGIGEATRVLLRRLPWKLLIKEKSQNDPALQHLIRLAEEKKVGIEAYPLINYQACGLIKNCTDL